MNKIISSHQGIKEALDLSEKILEEIELNSNNLVNISLKASRVARLLGDFDHQKIFLYESSGYPTTPDGVEHDVWRLLEIAGRIEKYEDKNGEKKKRAKLASIEELDTAIETAKDSLRVALDPSISITSANPYQHVSAPVGNSLERNNLRNIISEKTKLLANRRSFIYEYVSSIYYEMKYSAISNDIFSRIRAKVDDNIGKTVPDAVKKFTAVYENLVSENNEDWSNAVHSCRRILQDTADVLYPAREPRILNSDGRPRTINLGPDNYINRLITYVEENSDSERFQQIVGSHLKYLGERLDSIFQAAQKGSHSVISSKDEADRYVIYTYLVVGDILQLKSQIEKEIKK